MTESIPAQAVADLTTDKHWNSQTDSNVRRFKAYIRTQALRKLFGFIDPDDIQEIKAKKEFRMNTTPIQAAQQSSVSNIFDAENFEGKRFDLEYTREGGNSFPWQRLDSLLGTGAIVYDLPIRHLVVRFRNKEFKKGWEEAIADAIDDGNPNVSWVRNQFYAVFESKKPGNGDIRDDIRDAHDDFYYLPRGRASGKNEGLGWQPRTLDLSGIWSHNAWKDDKNTIYHTRAGGGFDWTPRRLEKYIMNYFDTEERYAGIIRDNTFLQKWLKLYPNQLTSYKEFEWEADEQWIQE